MYGVNRKVLVDKAPLNRLKTHKIAKLHPRDYPRDHARDYMYDPPLIISNCPVMISEYLLANTKAPSATSSGIANRPIGISLTSSARTAGSSSPKRAITSAVSVKPGSKQFTCTSGASSRAKHLVSEITPALAAQKLTPFLRPRIAEAADTLTIFP